jgi:hypothetical protein
MMNNPIVAELLLADEPPSGFKLLQTVYYENGGRDSERVYARLYKIAPAQSASGGG